MPESSCLTMHPIREPIVLVLDANKRRKWKKSEENTFLRAELIKAKMPVRSGI